MALDALIFDIDGTLLDTNHLHVEAWHFAFASHGYRIGRDRIESEIGKGGDKLVPAILGEQADRHDGDSLRDEQTKEFIRLAREQRVHPFPGALELIAAVRQRGLQIALATSSNEQHLRTLSESSGIELVKLADHVITSDDADESKPAPDLIEAATRRLRLSPAQCAVVGDTPYDLTAGKHAGVIGIGVRSGYQPSAVLLRAGARVVYADTAELLAHLDDALRRVSPTVIHLGTNVLEELMEPALAEAELGLSAGEAPIGCVLADGDGHIIARGNNRLHRLGDRIAHAEMVALRSAAGKLPDGRQDFILVSTLEPCVMCTGAAMEAAIDTIVYALPAPADSGSGRVMPPESPDTLMPRIVGGIRRSQSRELWQRFHDTTQDPRQRRFAEQLLRLTA